MHVRKGIDRSCRLSSLRQNSAVFPVKAMRTVFLHLSRQHRSITHRNCRCKAIFSSLESTVFSESIVLSRSTALSCGALGLRAIHRRRRGELSAPGAPVLQRFSCRSKRILATIFARQCLRSSRPGEERPHFFAECSFVRQERRELTGMRGAIPTIRTPASCKEPIA